MKTRKLVWREHGYGGIVARYHNRNLFSINRMLKDIDPSNDCYHLEDILTETPERYADFKTLEEAKQNAQNRLDLFITQLSEREE